MRGRCRMRGDSDPPGAGGEVVFRMDDKAPEISGEELFRRFKNNDEAAFEGLVSLYRNSLTRYIHRFVHDSFEAEELMIDAFAELALDTKYRGQASLKTYLFSIGRNVALRRVRKTKSSDYTYITIIEDTLGEDAFAGAENSLEADFIREEQKARLHTAMRTLKREYREVLHLIYFENMSYADAGTAMSKSVKQVENLTRRAKASLRIILDG